MIRIRSGKRGVSPLIATVLLIAFAVALGAVVMNWGRSYAQETADSVRQKSDIDVKCSIDVRLDVAKIGSTPQLCYGGQGTVGYIEATLLNTGSKDITAFRLTVLGAGGVYTNTTLNGTTIPAAGAIFSNISYDYTRYGPIQQIRFIPEVSIGGVSTPCSGNALEKDEQEIINCTA